jgi:soluble lytic murein transglycosylase-like protein
MLGFILSISILASTNFDKVVEAMIELESSTNNLAIGDNGRAYGSLQIHKGVVQDVNQKFGKEYHHEDMFSKEKSVEVLKYYFIITSEQVERKERRQATLEDLVRGWNGGAYNGWKKKATLKYWKKFKTIYENKK